MPSASAVLILTPDEVRLRQTRRLTAGTPTVLEVWPESHWPGFALRQSDVFQSYTAQ